MCSVSMNSIFSYSLLISSCFVWRGKLDSVLHFMYACEAEYAGTEYWNFCICDFVILLAVDNHSKTLFSSVLEAFVRIFVILV